MMLELFTIGIFLFTVLGLFRWVWWFSILDFFRLQYLFVAVILLCVSIYYVDLFSGVLNLASIFINLFRMRHYLPTFSPGNVYQHKDVLSVNAYKHNRAPGELKKLIKGAEASVVLIIELTDELEDEIHDALSDYKHRLETEVREGFRICLLSKEPLDSAEITEHGPGHTPLLQARTIIKGQTFQIYSAHPKPALSGKWFDERQDYFDDVLKCIKRSDYPVLMMGDFNSVPWEGHFQAFIKEAALKSTLHGYGYQVTWPAFLKIFGIPMDHILISKPVAYRDLCVGPYVGSDHYPISLSLGKGRTGEQS